MPLDSYMNAYDYALEAGLGEIGAFRFDPTVEGYVRFYAPSYRDGQKRNGWKTHLSVDAADAGRAADIVLRAYEQFGGIIFKVATPEELAKDAVISPDDPQIGKVFTLVDMGEKNWPRLIQKIEDDFHAAGIAPGRPVIEDAPVAGSLYAYRRNDKNPATKGYVSAEDAKKINPRNPSNPFNVPDPLESLILKQAQTKTAAPNTKAFTPDPDDLFAPFPAGYKQMQVSFNPSDYFARPALPGEKSDPGMPQGEYEFTGILKSDRGLVAQFKSKFTGDMQQLDHDQMKKLCPPPVKRGDAQYLNSQQSMFVDIEHTMEAMERLAKLDAAKAGGAVPKQGVEQAVGMVQLTRERLKYHARQTVSLPALR